MNDYNDMIWFLNHITEHIANNNHYNTTNELDDDECHEFARRRARLCDLCMQRCDVLMHAKDRKT